MREERKNEINEEIKKYFNYNDKIINIAKNIINRIEEETSEALWDAFDDELIWEEDLWIIIQYYIRPKDLGGISCFDIENMFFDDILKCIKNSKTNN